MPTGKYDHRGIPKIHVDLHPTHCRCGKKWGKHSRKNLEINIKPNCVACGKEIGVTKCKIFILNQYLERYIEKGNYCDECNAKASKHIHSSSLSFTELFKHKLK